MMTDTDLIPSMLDRTIKSYSVTTIDEGFILGFEFEDGMKCTIWPNGDIAWDRYDVVSEWRDGTVSGPEIKARTR